jgi:oligopeptide transport system ATP-binding protein
MSLLEVEQLKTYFSTPDGLVKAVDGVDLHLEQGSTVGLVGESGSGKSVLNLTILGLVPSPPAIIEAQAVRFEGEDLLAARPERLRQLRGNRIAMVFQDPMTSLNPFLTIGDQLSEPLLVHKGMTANAANRRIVELLGEVGISEPEKRLRAYPHEFSGGMRQRAMMAMALACEPTLLIADEPTTALDVTIQAQIMELLQHIREKHGTAIVLITHDLGVAAGFCDTIHVMYAGKIVESAPTTDLFARPAHPYTQALLRSVPRLDDDGRDAFVSIRGVPPDLTRLPPGCSFAPRCDHVIDRCASECPVLDGLDRDSSHRKACFVKIGEEARK